MRTYYEIVKDHLAGSDATYLQEILDHGIHSITNNFSSDDYDHTEIAREFHEVAQEKLATYHADHDIFTSRPNDRANRLITSR